MKRGSNPNYTDYATPLDVIDTYSDWLDRVGASDGVEARMAVIREVTTVILLPNGNLRVTDF